MHCEPLYTGRGHANNTRAWGSDRLIEVAAGEILWPVHVQVTFLSELVQDGRGRVLLLMALLLPGLVLDTNCFLVESGFDHVVR